MIWESEDEIQELVGQFENKTLPKEKWTHTAHLTTGIYYLSSFSFYEALCKIKANIISYNASLGNNNSATEGYHETLTVFWLLVIDKFIKDQKPSSMLSTCEQFLNSTMASKDYPLNYYRKETLQSTQARATWVAPQNGSWIV